MQSSIKIALGLGTASFALCACAAVLGIDDGHLRDDGDGGEDATTDTTTDVIVAETSSFSDASDANHPDATHVDGDGAVQQTDGGTGCETVDAPSDDKGVFVATDGTDGPSCGGHGAACKTVQFGINRAFDLGKGVVYVARGTYVESISLKAGITVDGGWDVVRTATDSVWSRACTVAASIIQGSATDPVTVHAEALGGHAKLSTLTITSKLASSVKPGESIIGILAASGTQLDLVAVDIQTVAGGDGAKGSQGSSGPAPGASCDAGADGAPAVNPGDKGDGADGGYFGAAGYVATSGAPGKQGSPGNNGAQAGKGTCVDCRTCETSGLACEDVDAGVACGSDGTTGCGGPPGGGGTPGFGGGSSVALVAWDNAQVSIVASSLRAGDGGKGGVGGSGGPGVNGSAGAPGNATLSCPTQCGGLLGLKCVAASGAGAAGTTGGTGGKGSAGGPGGDGSGGSSFAIVSGGGATVTKDTVTTLAFGNAAPAVGNGAPGHAGDNGP